MHAPPVQDLRRGTILCTIAHAIFVASNPTLAYEVSWDGPNYLRNDSMGTRGVVTLKNDALIGAFSDIHSSRSPFRVGEKQYDLNMFFRGIEPNLFSTAQVETLSYLTEEYHQKAAPTVTSAFWSSGDYLVGAESWDTILENGAHLIKIELLPTHEAIPLIEDDYEFNAKQVGLLKSLFRRRMGSESPLTLTFDELQVLFAQGREGIDASKTLLKSINISLGVI